MLFPVPAFDPAYTTPLAALTNPMSTAVCGSGVCQRILPVAGSSAAHEPPPAGTLSARPGPLSAPGPASVPRGCCGADRRSALRHAGEADHAEGAAEGGDVFAKGLARLVEGEEVQRVAVVGHLHGAVRACDRPEPRLADA